MYSLRKDCDLIASFKIASAAGCKCVCDAATLSKAAIVVRGRGRDEANLCSLNEDEFDYAAQERRLT